MTVMRVTQAGFPDCACNLSAGGVFAYLVRILAIVDVVLSDYGFVLVHTAVSPWEALLALVSSERSKISLGLMCPLPSSFAK